MSSIKLADVDDYINPSQACINPLFTSTKIKDKDSKEESSKGVNGSASVNGNATSITRRRRRRRTPLVISEPQIKVDVKVDPKEKSSASDTNTNTNANSSIHVSIDNNANPLNNGGILSGGIGSGSKSSDKSGIRLTPPVKRSSQILSYAIDDNDKDNEFQIGQSKPVVPHEEKDTKATVSVADCLACSGCITSAEAVLVTTQHSIETLLRNCSSGVNGGGTSTDDESKRKKRIVFTISPVVIADLIRILMTTTLPSSSSSSQGTGSRDSTKSIEEQIKITYQKLTSFLHERLNASIVLDGTIPQQMSLMQSAMEFCTRYQYLHPDYRYRTNMKNTIEKVGEQQEQIQNQIRNRNRIRNRNTQNGEDTRIKDINTPSIALSATETRYLVRPKTSSNGKNKGITEGIEIKHQAGIDPRLHFLQQNTKSDHHQQLPNTSNTIQPERILPMLASSCPGFVCYVEKTTPDIIANLCTVKSPMAIAGSMFKHDILGSGDGNTDTNVDIESKMTKSLNVSNNEDHVYHVAIMPCHDKKLEAERKDLAWERYIEQQEKLVADVDLVITTNELFSILTQSALEGKSNLENSAMETGNDEKEALKIVQEFFFDLPLAPVSAWEDIDDCNGAYISSLERSDVEISRIMKKGVDWTMKGSGSYAEFIFRFAALALFDHYIPINEPLPWKSMSRRGSAVSRTNRRNLSVKDQGHYSDHSEVTLYQHGDGTFSCKPLGDKADQDEGTVLKFATAYGFKNIQLLMQKIRNSQDSKYHYVETMACPSGCLNGGGQIKPETILNAGKKDSSSAVKRREKPSEKRDRVLRGKYFLSDFAPSEKGDKVGVHENQTHLLHTKYHVVPKLELATGSTAGVAVDDTHW